MLTKTGRKALLPYLLDPATTQIKFRLYKNDFAAGNADAVIGSLTQATFTGYAAKTTVAFPAPSINGDGAAESESDTLTWTAGEMSGSETIYGIYATVFDLTTEVEVLLWYDRFAASITINLEGQEVAKKVKFLDTNYAP